MNRQSRLYHGTYITNVDSIQDSGINVGIDGLVYLCPSIEDVFQFGYRWWASYSSEEKHYVDHPVHGKMEFPKFIEHKEFAVFEIDGDKLDWDKMEEGIDHNPAVITAQVLAYNDIIPPECIIDVRYFGYEKGNEDEE